MSPEVQPLPGRFDDRVHEEAEAGGGERGPGQVERAGPGIAALGHVADAEQQRGGRERHVDHEHRRPVEPLEQQPTRERAEPDPDRGQRRPDARSPCGAPSPVNRLAMIESVAGMISAAPTPIAARTAITWFAESAIRAPRLASPKIETPTWSARLRPKRSPSVPNTSSSPAKTSR